MMTEARWAFLLCVRNWDYFGVWYCPTRKKWLAMSREPPISAGYHDSPRRAARAYDRMARFLGHLDKLNYRR